MLEIQIMTESIAFLSSTSKIVSVKLKISIKIANNSNRPALNLLNLIKLTIIHLIDQYHSALIF